MHPNIESNPIIDRLPSKLKQYIKPQNYDQYTEMDQAVWRYVMRKNVNQLKEVAHESYLEGLEKTGITIDRIPSMYGMNRILQEIGWAAVAVDGLIPSDAFMEFQAYNTLVIASDIRQYEHIEYTPTPDIIHESAGHAPILANREYAEYLRRFGQIGSKAISSALDNQLYEAVRTLSILKESTSGNPDEIERAEIDIKELQSQITDLSEMTQMRNLHWWTVEYGLIGSINSYKQYGAGLLSSIGESKWCMSDQVKKLPYNIDAAQQNFDVTKPQPLLFVTPDFAHLNQVLEEFANTLSVRKGGRKGLVQLIESKSLGTIELSTGLQISGIFDRIITSDRSRSEVVYFQTTGNTALANRDKEITGHGRVDHSMGIGSPLGYLKGYNLAIEDMSPRDLIAYGIYENKRKKLEFEGGVSVEGRIVTGARNLHGKIQTIYLDNCTVRYQDEVLYTPDMGTYCLAVGKDIVSAFAGPADDDSFDLITHKISEENSKIEIQEERKSMISLFKEVKLLSEEKNVSPIALKELYQKAIVDHADHWLLFLELFELAHSSQYETLAVLVKNHLLDLGDRNNQVIGLIKEGIELVLNNDKIVA
tara:strand:- start:280 stop:2055 length:1776 start_codon:yes stop_codon:yes gene_type:complete